ncbi:unnamed protein product [Caenorhabditis auriculariae]|uniref:CWF21 domain-containing protein n=1 Tax=Caenorhabditis auriculariae TaxID=2777116 RepID=A0A8S1HK16_9PELO|nr:unnamed protein product [Caenorhabditis auriculariae]
MIPDSPNTRYLFHSIMYNGIGLQTARGTGTNGYVQSNLSHLLLARKKIEYNGEDDLRRMEAEVNKTPNAEILDHQRKRQIEVKCTEVELLMEEKGFDDDEIQKKVDEYRQLLLSQLKSGELNLDDELDTRDSHARRQFAQKGRDRMREALGVNKDFVAGSSMANMNKTDVVGAALSAPPVSEKEDKEALLATLKKHEKQKAKEKKQAKKQKSKKRKRKVSTSSSSSSSSDDSSESSASSSESESSEDEKRKKKKKSTKRKHEKAKNRQVVKEEQQSPVAKKSRRENDRQDENRSSKKAEAKKNVREEERIKIDTMMNTEIGIGTGLEGTTTVLAEGVSNRLKEGEKEEVKNAKKAAGRGPERFATVPERIATDPERIAGATVTDVRVQNDVFHAVDMILTLTRDPPQKKNPLSKRLNKSRKVNQRQLSHLVLDGRAMAFLDRDELLDVIRHEMRLEDEHGLCARLLQPVIRRSKYGGLPLGFRMSSLREDVDDEFEEGYNIPLYEEPIHTRDIIREQMDHRVFDKNVVASVVPEVGSPRSATELFIEHKVAWPPSCSSSGPKSAVDRYLEANASSLNSQLREFARFAGTTDQPSRTIHVFFAPEGITEGPHRDLEISVLSSAKVKQAIGYCSYKFLLDFGELLPGQVDDYQLFMAEDDGEISTDFPPHDHNKLIGQFGFDVLGLVRTQTDSDRLQSFKVIVHFTSRDQYTIEVDSGDRTLKWLKDEALRRRDEKMKADGGLPEGFLEIRDYHLEPADQFDVKLDEELTVKSVGVSEFVMVRKNSSRGDFHPLGVRFGRQFSAMTLLTGLAAGNPGPMSPRTPLPTLAEQKFEFPPTSPSGMTTRPVTLADLDGQLSAFVVWRIHRVKPRWKANLVLRWTCFEISRLFVDKTAFLPQGYQKHTSVPWENVGGVRVHEKDAKPGSERLWQLTLWWLPILEEEAVRSVVGDEEWSYRHIIQLYKTENAWKKVTVESSKNTEIAEAASQVNSILQARDTAVFRTFNHSECGARPPASAAEIAMMDSTDGPLMTSPTPTPKSKYWKMKKLVRVFRRKPVT